MFDYVETSYGNLGDLSTLAYDGSACAALGLAVTSVRLRKNRRARAYYCTVRVAQSTGMR